MMKLVVAMVAVFLGTIWNCAQAGVISSLSGPGSILEGQTASLSATLTDTGSPTGYFGEVITGISYSFGSGDGQTYSGNITGLNTSSYFLSDMFSYAADGIDTPFFSAVVTTADQYLYWVDTSHWVTQGYWGEYSYSYSCGWWRTCYGWNSYWVDTSYYQNSGYQATGVTSMQYTTNANTQLVVSNNVPEPATIVLLGIALVGLGATRRRKQTAA